MRRLPRQEQPTHRQGSGHAALFFGETYTTQVDTITFEPSGPQIQGLPEGGFVYEDFFGVGGTELVGGDFSLGGGVSVDVPFTGETELFGGHVDGSLGAKFGLNVRAELDPGSIDARLPYEIGVAYPTIGPETAPNDSVNLFFAHAFAPEADSGFTTSFPALLFELELVAIIDALLGADIRIPGASETFEVFDFRREIAVPLISVDTNRQTAAGDADPINLFGIDTQTLVDKIPNIEEAETLGGEFAGVRGPLNSFFSAPDAKAADKPVALGRGDRLVGEGGNDTLRGGDGDDFLAHHFEGFVSGDIKLGDGDDDITVRDGGLGVLDLGAGDDIARLAGARGLIEPATETTSSSSGMRRISRASARRGMFSSPCAAATATTSSGSMATGTSASRWSPAAST